MKYIIMGFLQSKLMELGLDVIDALLLRYFVDFKESKSMKVEVVEDKIYYWLNYEGVLRELPILNIKKCTVQSRFFKLRDAGVLTHYVKKVGGTYSFFGIGERYADLIGTMENQENNIQEGMDIKLHPVDLYREGCQFKLMTNNPSTKDPSINTSIVALEEVVSEIIDYLNGATGKHFRENTKATAKLIKGRLKEGFTLKDFKTVIDNMTPRWRGTRFQQYLAPTTLFGSKFETYLQCESLSDGEEGRGKYNALNSHEAMGGTRVGRIPKRGNVGSLSGAEGEIPKEEVGKEEVSKESHSSRVQEGTGGQPSQELILILKEDM